MDILIGRDPQQSNLLVVVKHNGQSKATRLGQPGCVPNSVSRCNVANGTAHCLVTYDADTKQMRVENLKPENVTYVNDKAVITKQINAEDQLALGKDRFVIGVQSIQKIVGSILGLGGNGNQVGGNHGNGEKAKESKSIAHLEAVWKRYEQALENIRRKQQALGRKRLLPIMLSSCGGVITAILGTLQLDHPMYFTLALSLTPLLMYIKIYNEKDTSIEDTKKAENELIAKYVCPHKDCGVYFNKQPFVVVRNWKICPHCKKPLHV